MQTRRPEPHPQSTRPWLSFPRLALVTVAAVIAGGSCAGEYHPPTAPPPRAAARELTKSQAPAAPAPDPRHGFDPRDFYGLRAISVQRGAASFYAERFAGRRTANGERYDPKAYTAAHRTLPFGSVVRVVYEKTGDWVLVRINDRGPYGPSKRVIDLSREAARRLSMLDEGVVRVRLELLERGAGGYRHEAGVSQAARER